MIIMSLFPLTLGLSLAILVVTVLYRTLHAYPVDAEHIHFADSLLRRNTRLTTLRAE